MATKTCINGHQYDANIYGDNCPFCPSANKTAVLNEGGNGGNKTTILNGNGGSETVGIGGNPTIGSMETQPINIPDSPAGMPMGGGATIIRPAHGNAATGIATGGRRLVGLLVSYDVNPLGEVYKIFEGRNMIGRAATSDIPIPTDSNMSSQHLLILYREAEDIFWAADQNSSNGTYINGAFVSDRIKLQTNDVIVVGGTKFTFIAIPR